MLTPESRVADFPPLGEMIYLNTAAESIPPVIVNEAVETYLRDKSRGMAGRDAHFAERDQCRQVAADLLEKKPAEIAFCSCTSEAYNLLASALQLGGEDEVVITDLDFPSGATPWIRSPESPSIKLWRNQDGVLELDDLRGMLSEKTKLVQVSLVSFLTGYRIEWAPFRDAVRELAPHAILSVDVTQCFGRIELDCLDADCIIGSSYKWLLGIHGGCVISVSESVSNRLTTFAGGWYHIENAFDEDRFSDVRPMVGADSFSVGMPNFSSVYAMRAGMQYLNGIGVPEIAVHADSLVAQLHAGLAELGLKTMAPAQPGNSAGIVAFQHERDAEICEALLAENIHVMHQAGRLRIAIHGYNQASDIDALIGVLKKFSYHGTD